MKKLVLAAALTSAFAGSAFAQSSVTLYGRINTTIEYQDNELIDKTVLSNNASRWGINGKEDLGGGLSAFFQLEAGFASDTGAGTGGFNRDAFVGLTSTSLGQIKLGKFTSALYYGTIDYIGVFNHDTGVAEEDNIYALTAGYTNAVQYTSPKFGPFEFALEANASEGTGPKTYAGVVNYDQGDLHIGAGYSQTKSVLDQKVIEGFSAAVSYVFGPLTVGAAYEHDKDEALGKRDAVTGTAMYTLGASEFHLSIGWAGEYDNVPNSDALQYLVGYNYNLSKRTKLYAFYFALDNKAGASYVPFGGGGASIAALPDKTFSSLGVGIRHNF
jgi:predicted porin